MTVVSKALTCRVWFNKSSSSIHGVLRQLRQGWGSGLTLIGTHTRGDFGPLLECHLAKVEPEGLSSAAYLSWCLEFCRRHQVQVFVPGRMRIEIADHLAAFERLDTRLIVAGGWCNDAAIGRQGAFFGAIASVRADTSILPRPQLGEFEAACEELTRDGLQVCFKPVTGIFGLGFYVLDEGMTPLRRLLRSEVHRISKGELESSFGASGEIP